jgi:hypothetical protein
MHFRASTGWGIPNTRDREIAKVVPHISIPNGGGTNVRDEQLPQDRRAGVAVRFSAARADIAVSAQWIVL